MLVRFSIPRLTARTIEYVIDQWGPITGRTRLVKLLFLSDRKWYLRHGHTYTEAQYYRYTHGPFAREILDALGWMDGVEVVESALYWEDKRTYEYSSGRRTRLADVELENTFRDIIDSTCRRWKDEPLSRLLDHVYALPEFQQTEFGEPILG